MECLIKICLCANSRLEGFVFGALEDFTMVAGTAKFVWDFKKPTQGGSLVARVDWFRFTRHIRRV